MRSIIFALTLLTAGLAAPLALADKPAKNPAPGSNFTDTTTCGFPVDVTYTVNGQSAIVFSDGKIIISGPLAAEFSANGKSVTVNIAGPATVTPTASSVTIEGHGVGAGPMLLPDGSVTLTHASGQVSIDPSTGIATLIRGTIHLDICKALTP